MQEKMTHHRNHKTKTIT